MFPRSDPRRPQSMVSLASLRRRRYILSNQREDLEKEIVHLTESILLPPASWPQHRPLILYVLFNLANALAYLSQVTKQPGDVISASKFLLHLRDQPHKIPHVPRHIVTALLVETLAFRVKLEAGNLMQNIREIAILSRELLTMETSDIDTTRLIDTIWNVVRSKDYLGVSGQPLDELIQCLRVAMKRRPDLPQGRAAFAMSLVCRYHMTSADEDYEEAMPILDKIITSGNSQDKFLTGFATGLAASLAMIRSQAHWSPEYLEEAIYRTRTCHSSSSFTEVFSHLPWDPDVAAKERFRYFGPIEGVEGSPGPLVSGLGLETPESAQKLDEMMLLSFVISNHGDTTMIDGAIELGRSIAASSDKTHILNTFGDMLHEAFVRTKKIEYLNESISVRRQILESPFSHVERLRTLPLLPLSLLARSQYSPGYRTQDLDEGLEILIQCVNNTHVSLPNRLRLSCAWAYHARRTRQSSVSTAYETAMSMMQDTLLSSPTLQLQHTILAILATHKMEDTARNLPLDYASYQVDHHQLEEAIETLERGRTLLWSEMRHLRTSIDQLLEADSDLGRKFAEVNRDLEELTKSVPPSHKLSMDDCPADNLRAVDPFGRLLLKQRNLLKERAKLISQIQSLPGFDGFLASKSFNTIRSSALSGPVIIINHSWWRSDILILLHDMPPSLIPTPHDSYNRATALKDKLMDSRREYGLDSSHYEETLGFVLDKLYKLVGKPVIDRLRQLRVPEQSRIWWCPTSVFFSLPLHAMGPIPSMTARCATS
jgi:tetratricopeptide (TPR) repeat protein